MILIFLGVLLLMFVIECFLLEIEQWGLATFTFIAGVCAVQFFGLANIWGFVTHHSFEALLYGLGYLVVGVVWSFVKWYSFLMGFRDKYHQLKKEFYERHSIPLDQCLPPKLAEEFNQSLWLNSLNRYHGVSLSRRPSATSNKRRIMAWLSLWPFSMVGTLINDPIRRLFKFIFNQLKALYQRIADHVFRNDPDLK